MMSALSNPKVMFAVSEDAPMSVVARRQANAAVTAKEVERLLLATPVASDSAWMKAFAASPDEGTAILEKLKTTIGYTSGPKPVKVLPAEAWSKLLAAVKSSESGAANLLTTVSPDIYSSYVKILDKKKQIADLKSKQAEEDKAIDAAKTDADKQAHKDAKAKLGEQIDKASDEVNPLVKKFIEDTKTSAAKVAADVRDKVGPTIVNLRKAVDDASVSNSAAILRYPLAIPELSDTNKLIGVVADVVADTIEQQTGTRPTMQGLDIKLTLEGMKPNVVLNGLTPDDMGKLKMDDLVAATVKGTGTWLADIVLLVPRAVATADLLAFEGDTLDAITQGFTSAGWKAPAGVVFPEVQSTPKPQKK
jgi:vacuolar-type H+-ATPase subunit H